MKIAITGAAGRIGSATLALALQNGHDVLAIDRVTGRRRGRETWYTINLNEPLSSSELLCGVEAIVHLAGIAAPTPERPFTSFQSNVLSTFNIFTAAAEAGVPTVVFASSASALGRAWAKAPADPLFFPIDEEHPLRPADHYALAKQIAENIGHSFSREHGLASVAMRFPWVADDETLADKIELVRGTPAEEISKRDLWSYVHLDDIARAFLHVATAHPQGFEVYDVVAPDTLSDIPTQQLIAQFFPFVPVRKNLGEHEPAWSAEKIARNLGYRAQVSWRDRVASVSGQ